LNNALEKWLRALPPGVVRISPVELQVATQSTFLHKLKVIAILVPESVAEIAVIVRIAAEAGQPIYPYSRGRNWGLGSKLPVIDECALLDLSSMDKILDYDEELGTITVEPGVHFSQIAAFLKEKKSLFYASVTGGPPYGSLIGNALERGGGDGPLGQRAKSMTALEVVLGTGEIIRTGFSRFARSSTAHLMAEGVGYSLVDLFTQSNLGVVTQATFWLNRKPVELAYLIIEIEKTGELQVNLETLRDLLQTDTLDCHSVSIWNGYKTLARTRKYDRNLTFRPESDLKALFGVAAWAVTLKLPAPNQEILKAKISHIQSCFERLGKKIRVLKKSDMSAAMWAYLEPGNPTGINVTSAYWRKSGDLPGIEDLDPDRDQCGILWICPSLPFNPMILTSVMHHLETIILDFNFEPNIGLNPISSRAVEVYIAIMYDLTILDEAERAMKCHDFVMQWLLDQGHLPYRLGVHSMNQMPECTDDSFNLFLRLKKTFDPAEIISPGRYLKKI
jgi:4-cresol dehydrogenase (hydroxylating)